MNPRTQIDQTTNRPSFGPGRLEPVPLGPLSERPLVSVLMANYNYGAYIGEAIESVLSQTYDHWELLVADDGSTDDSCAVVERYAGQDARITLLRSTQNRGQADGFNRAYAASRGEVICLLDSDDTMAPTKLARMVECFQAQPHVGLVNHRVMMVDATGRAIQEIPYTTHFEHGWIAERVIRRGGRWRSMPGCAMAFRREVADLAFPIPEAEGVRSADGYLVTLLPLLTEVAAVDDVLYHYRIHGRNDTGNDRLTPSRLEKYVQFQVNDIACVNQRLAALRMPERLLDLRRNLWYAQLTFELHLVQGRPRKELWHGYTALLPQLVRDDLYGPLVGLARSFIYGMAILLPLSYRAKLLDFTLGYNPVKERLRLVVRRTRGLVSVARRRSGAHAPQRRASRA